MSDYIKKIKTADGDKQIDYTALANLPKQYTGTGQNKDGWMTQKAVTDCLTDAANAIICSASGEAITIVDGSNYPLKGLNVYGKSTQDGDPTPDNPVEIVSLPAPVITVTNGTEENIQTLTITTPESLPGIPVTSDGNYTDADGQMWVCDEVDMARGVYIQRIATIDLSTLSTWTKGTGNGWANASAFYSSNALPDAVIIDGYETIANILCNRLVVGKPSNIAGTMVNRVGQGTGTSLYVSIEGIETAEDLIAYLNENETIVQYILALPIETALTDDEIAAYQALHTNYPSTTISNNAGAYMSIKYVADTKTYIDNLVAGIYAATVE